MTERLLRIPRYIFFHILRMSLPLITQERKKLASCTRSLDSPPIFIVGPPRSGTTLLYQLMVHHFHIAYFPGIANRFYTSPVFATKWGLKRCHPYLPDFTSNYGHVDGAMAPSEANGIWNRWFPNHRDDGCDYTPAGYFEDETRHIIYQAVTGIEKLFNAPFVSKNVNHSVRIQSLVDIFPNALFIQIMRDSFDTAISLLKARQQKYGNVNTWWSVMPKEIDQFRDLDYLDQICGQVFYTEKNIEEDIASVGSKRRHITHYERLCQDTHREMNQIATFIQSHSCHLRRKHEIPGSFTRSRHKGETLSDKEESILEILSRYYG